MRKEFHRLLSLEEARSVILRHLPPSSDVEVPLSQARGRILAEEVVSSVDVPGFDRASMDGYAVRAEDSLGAREDRPLRLKLIGSVAMGVPPKIEVGRRQAAEVSTGSMIPQGADAVVMVEHSEVEGGELLVSRPVYCGENVQRAGSDIALGETVLHPGTVLTTRELGVLAAVGKDRVLVKSLRVGVASTGNELVLPGEPLGPGKIYDINSYTIAAALEDCGAVPALYGILPDDRDLLSSSLKSISKEVDMLLVSGSTSAGLGDMLYRILEKEGIILFHGINLKPGKPTIFGLVEDKPVYGLPGYPTSALTVFSLLVAPAVRRVLGYRSEGLRLTGRLLRPVRSEGRHQMLAVGVSRGLVYPVDKGSGSITTLAKAEGVIELPPALEYLDSGETVDVHLFAPHHEPNLVIAGEDCPVVHELIRTLPLRVMLLIQGGERGVLFLQDGLADLACISSLGDLTPLPGLTVVRGYSRELGLMAKNPDAFDKLEGAKMWAWSRESQMSVVAQDVMKEVLNKADVKDICWTGQAMSHKAVARAVACGMADLGFGSRLAAEREGLSFKKLVTDRVDFLVKSTNLEGDSVQSFLAALRNNLKASPLPGISFD